MAVIAVGFCTTPSHRCWLQNEQCSPLTCILSGFIFCICSLQPIWKERSEHCWETLPSGPCAAASVLQSPPWFDWPWVHLAVPAAAADVCVLRVWSSVLLVILLRWHPVRQVVSTRRKGKDILIFHQVCLFVCVLVFDALTSWLLLALFFWACCGGLVFVSSCTRWNVNTVWRAVFLPPSLPPAVERICSQIFLRKFS